jgi:hypothetical protein
MVGKGSGDKVNLPGVERCSITAIHVMYRQIRQAEMIDLLNVRMSYNSSAHISSYDAEIRLTIKRALHIELLK